MGEPFFACDFVGLFNRSEEGFVVRFKRPGRLHVEAQIEEKDIKAWSRQIERARMLREDEQVLDVSMLTGFREAE